MAKKGLTLKTLSGILKGENKKWGLCIGAGTSLPIVPDWYSLIEKIITDNIPAKECIDIDKYKSMGFSADAMMQAVLNKLKISDEEFSVILSRALFAQIKEHLSIDEWEAFRKVHDCIGIAGITNNTWSLFEQVKKKLLEKTSANLIAQSIIKGIKHEIEPDAILTFNAEAMFLSLLNYYYFMEGISKKNKFDRVMNSLSSRMYDRIPYIHCHGAVLLEGSKMKWGRNAVDKLVFSEASYLDLANSSFSWQSANFIDCCLRNKIVFIGVSFADTNMRRWLSSIHKSKMEDLQKNGGSHMDTTEHYWINRKPSSTTEMRWIEETVAHLGVRLIWIDDWKDVGLVMDTLMGIA